MLLKAMVSLAVYVFFGGLLWHGANANRHLGFDRRTWNLFNLLRCAVACRNVNGLIRSETKNNICKIQACIYW